MTYRLLAPLRDLTEEEMTNCLNILWKGYDWETIVAQYFKARAQRLARQCGSASEHSCDPEVK
jgi:glutathionylspermidine synthase